ncbi:hypothetical protein BGW36DRAFT_371532 [Talaromyces proteolyticus]|uniref:ER membrane protein complex subunit 1 n=1 Tax=Talaromyces proteolyticus TaxID=1131652 RepID=A0AAD4KWU3_9EURO|nr:uncharacterized protein BGW36DRAFT_371532 [Talaromyces proteolyticus]KAH8701770.1 hypothetical protein BGW36DRAFT_371532 [Talaromyces proteolyticus]
MMWFQTALVLLASCATKSLAIFADEVNHLDYHHELLGTPSSQSTFFHRPSSTSNASLLYTVSENLVVAAVNPKDGTIVWRQDLAHWTTTAKHGEGFLRASDGESTVVSAAGDIIVSWGATDGKLAWKVRPVEGVVKDLELLELEDGRTTDDVRDVLALSGDKTSTVQRLDGTTGKAKWAYKDDSGDVPFQVSSSSTEIFYISLQSALLKGNKIRVTVLDSRTGRQTRNYVLSSESEVSGPGSILYVGANTASPFIAWADKSNKALKVNILGSKNVNTLNIENATGDEISKISVHGPEGLNCLPHFLVHYETDTESWAEVYHIDLKSSSISKAYQLPRLGGISVFAASHKAANVFFTRITDSEVSVVGSVSHGVLGRWPFKNSSGETIKHALAEVVSKGTSAVVRFAYVLESGDWKLNRNSGTDWTRHESLFGAVAAGWAEPNSSEELVHELELEGHEDILSAYIHRVKRHTRDLQHLPKWLQELPGRIFTSFISAEVTNLDSFGLRKLVLVATERGRVIAIDTGNHGAVVWNTKVADTTNWNVKAIKTAFKLATVYIEDGSSVSLNVTTGEIISHQESNSNVQSVAYIPDESSTGTITIGVAKDGTPSEPLHSSDYLVTLSDDGRVLGWILGDNKTPVWQFLPPHGERVIHATSRPSHDPVASIGKVLGNRSVLYKYLNPNLALVTSVGHSSVTFHLLDAISGIILYSSTYTGVDITQPITSVISENWFACSFWADLTNRSESKGYQLVVSELYESPVPNDRGPLDSALNYSSISGENPLPRPYVLSQAFVIPEPISHMAVTQTRQGITVRQLICTLPSSNSIVGIPRNVLDPRRPVGRDPTAGETEEGLFKYSPYLEFDGRWYLTHSRDVAGIQKVISSPTLLESTTLVFAFGGDIFGTRATPSQAFDILGSSFSKLQLLATVVALAVGVWFLAPMVRSKQINLLWKRM